MPLLRYTFRHPEGHELTEEDYFKFSNDDFTTVKTILEKEVKGAELLSINIKNPFIGHHDWSRTHRAGDRIYYVCGRCDCVSYRRFSNFKGEFGEYIREDKWKSAKYDHCHEPLKQMPPSTSLFR